MNYYVYEEKSLERKSPVAIMKEIQRLVEIEEQRYSRSHGKKTRVEHKSKLKSTAQRARA